MVWKADTAGYLLRPWLITPLTDWSSPAELYASVQPLLLPARVAELLRVLQKGWLLTVDQGKIAWSYFIPLVIAMVLFCHLWDALFGPFLLMSSYNSLACFCRMIAGISTITDCGTLFILTLEAVGKACAHVVHAPVCFWWSQLSTQGGKTIVEHVHGTILWNALDSVCFYHCPPFWQFPANTQMGACSSYCQVVIVLLVNAHACMWARYLCMNVNAGD